MENTSKETITTETEKPGAEASSLKGGDAKRSAKASMQVGKTATLILINMLSGNQGRDNSAKCSSSPCSGGKFVTAILAVQYIVNTRVLTLQDQPTDSLQLCYFHCSPHTTSTSILRELVRKADSGPQVICAQFKPKHAL